MAGKQDFITELVNLKVKDENGNEGGGQGDNHGDDLYESTVEAVIREQRGSVSMLQRIFKIGYGRAARLIDFMAEDGVVGPYNGKIREVVMTIEQWRRKSGGSLDDLEPTATAPANSVTNHAVAEPPRRPTVIHYHDDPDDEDPSEDAAGHAHSTDNGDSEDHDDLATEPRLERRDTPAGPKSNHSQPPRSKATSRPSDEAPSSKGSDNARLVPGTVAGFNGDEDDEADEADPEWNDESVEWEDVD